MSKKFVGRCLAALLSLLMVLTMIPDSAIHAAEVHTETHVHDEEAMEEFQATIDDILDWYLVQQGGLTLPTTTLTGDDRIAFKSQMKEVVDAMDLDTRWMAQVEIYDLSEEMEDTLCQDEIDELIEHNPVFEDFADLVCAEEAGPNTLASDTFLNGDITISNDKGDFKKISDTSVEVKAEGGLIGTQTATLTVTNNSGNTATLAFTYGVSGNTGGVKINNGSADTSGTYSAILENGKSMTISVAGKRSYGAGKATLTLSGISLTPLADNPEITFEYDATRGSVTVAGKPIENGTSQEFSSSEEVTLVATANGTSFMGWTNGDGIILSKDATYTFRPANDMVIRAVFAKNGGNAVFGVGGATQKSTSEGYLLPTTFRYYTVDVSYLFDDLADAINTAKNSNNKSIVLMNNGVINGRYVIPNGVTLLIPFDDANTLNTTTPIYKNAEVGSPVAYRTLTMASGASITVENGGAISVSATVRAAAGSKRGGGVPLTAYGYIKMQDNSSITVNSGGNLYCYGYIGGTGNVHVKSGASVYETFQIEDFRGGGVTSSLASDDHGFFPMNSYYVQNILVQMKLEKGATEYANAGMHMNSTTFGTTIAFIASSDAMFNITSGAVTKEYDYATDRVFITATEGSSVNISNIELSISSVSMDSKEYDLPLNGNLTIIIEKNSEIVVHQDIVLLPGVEVYIKEGATCTLSEGSSMFIFDMDQWPMIAGSAYVSSNNVPMYPAYYVPERQYTRSNADLKDVYFEVAGVVDASGNVFTTGTIGDTVSGGAWIAGKEGAVINMGIADDDVVHYQLIQHVDGLSSSTWVSIPITTAKLKNADGSYTDPTKINPEVGNTYTYIDGVWVGVCRVVNEHSNCEPNIPDDQVRCDKPQLCIYCGKILKSVDHVPGPAATCTDSQTCTVCTNVLVEALGHNVHEVITHPGTAATCTTVGSKDYYECPRCHVLFADKECTTKITDVETWKVTKGQGLIEAKGHIHGTPVKEDIVLPTCIKEGSHTEVTYCTVCGDEVNRVTGVVDAMIPHSYSSAVTQTPTCSAPGVTTYTCTISGCTASYTEEIATIPHTSNGATVDCTTAELCSVCKAEMTPALGHTPGEPVDENLNEETGAYEEVIYCTVCQAEISRREVTDSTEYHKHENLAAVNPTCTQVGWTAGSKCITVEGCDCGEEQEEIPALGHTLEGAVLTYSWNDTYTECTATGTCTRCQESYSVSTTNITTNVVAETCTTAGYTTYVAVFEDVTVANCTETKKGNTATGHNWGEAVYTWTEDLTQATATCTCQNDGSHVETETVNVVKTTTNATCETDGVITYTADFQKTLFVDQQKTDTGETAHGHKWIVSSITWSVADENNLGCVINVQCEHNASHVREGVSATSVTKNVVADTCTVAGSTTYTATFADQLVADQIKTETGRVLGHDWNNATVTYTWAEDYSTCTATRTCQRGCGHSETETVNATLVSETATCIQAGVRTYRTETFQNPAFAQQTKPVDQAALGHNTIYVDQVDASCTATGKKAHYRCERCNGLFTDMEGTTSTNEVALIIPMTAHSYDGGEITQDPTCTETGIKTYTCTVCSGTKEESVAASGHTWTDATCTTPKTCSVCNTTEGNPNGHSWVDATCIAPKTCSVCGETEDTALGHNYNEGIITQDPTCDEAGIKTFTCTRCGDSYTESVDATGHTPVVIPAVAPGCTTTGLAEGSKCSVCEKTLVEQEIVPEKGHTPEAIPAVAPKCEVIGWTEGIRCSDCPVILEAPQQVDRTGHDYQGEITTLPGCGTTGVKTFTCTHDASHTYTEEVPAVGHNILPVLGLDATCNDAGYNAYYQCMGEITLGADGERTYCGQCYEDAEGNTPIEDIEVWKTTPGMGYVQATGHSYTSQVTQNPTCSAVGVKTFTCDSCSDSYTEDIPMVDHTWDNGSYVSEADKPTCTEEGTLTYDCTQCDATKTETVAATGHDWFTQNSTPATCTTPGWTGSAICGNCLERTSGQVIPVTDHTWDNGTVTQNATCESEGVRTYTCTNPDCDATRTVSIPKLAHSTTLVPAQEATCLTAGNMAYYTCSTCTNIFTDSTAQNVTDMASVTVAQKAHVGVICTNLQATCTTDGYKVYYQCELCQIYYADQACKVRIGDSTALTAWQTTEGLGLIKKFGHTVVIDRAVAADCINSGLTEGSHCSVCSEVLVAQEVVDALGHSNIDQVTTPETCTKDGVMTHTCSVCGYTSTSVIPAKGHDWKITYTWNETFSQCTATAVCNHDASHVETETSRTITAVADPDADCTTNGVMHYTATFTNTLFETQQTNAPIIAPGHAWADATCTTPKTCSICGETEGTALGHDMADATCTAPKTCKICGHTEGVALGHTWADATCTAPKTCSTCGETEGTALGHTWTDATCSTPKTCDTCGVTEGNVKPHTMVLIPEIQETCTTNGRNEYYYCSSCLERFKDINGAETTTDEAEIVPMTGHDYAAVVTPPTCTEQGYTTHTCNNGCGSVIVDTYVDALGHSYDNGVITEDPSCTEAGVKIYTCGTCGHSYTEEVAATGHNEVIIPAVPSTCTQAGATQGSKCSICGTVSIAPEVVPAKGHTPEDIPGKAADCTNSGLTQGSKCSVCGEILVEQEVIPAKGHTSGQMVVENQVAADCTKNGSHDEVIYCTVCNAEISRTSVIDEAVGHAEETIPAVNPSCTATGLTAGVKCSVCGEILTAQTLVEMLPHTEVVDEAVESTCTSTGLTEGKHCSVCGTKTVVQSVVGMKGHTYKTANTVYPTCTEDGLRTLKCSGCGAETEEVITATGHTEETIPAVAPGCTTPGLTEGVKCSTCHTILDAQESVNPLGHSNTTVVTPPTCTEQGYSTHTCDVCGNVSVDTVVEKLPHNSNVIIPAVGATCTETGLTEGKKCSVCGTVVVAQQTVAAKGHTEVVDPAKAATCTEAGLTEGKHCSVCNTVLVAQEVVSAKGHAAVELPAVSASCTATGLTVGSKCGTCGTVLVEQEVIPKLEHQYNEGNITTLPTCTSTGIKRQMCTLCKGTKETVIPPSGHNTVHHEAKLPTNYSVGWEAYETCTECSYTTYVEIPAIGEPQIKDYDTFLENLKILEEYANAYVKLNPGKDPLMLIIKYIRTGVDRYNSGSWNIMAGYEDAGFAAYVKEQEEAYNKNVVNADDMIIVTGLKNIYNFKLPSGEVTDIGHMFGTMDISYTNTGSVNHADVAGWGGDTTDLLSLADQFGVSGKLDEMIAIIAKDYFLKASFSEDPIEGTFSQTDVYGDLDGYYMINELEDMEYEAGDLYKLISNYFTEDLTDADRAKYFLDNRLGGVSSYNGIREAVFEAYTGNSVIATLEATRDFNTEDLSVLRKACCYAVADYLWKLAGDYVELVDNKYFEVTSTVTSTLAPGVTQEINTAATADGKQIVYYLATADINSSYVSVYANYKDADPTKGWGMQRVLDQALAAQNRYGNPDSPDYIENYQVIASINGAGYDMTTGEPGGLLIMGGTEYHAPNANGFFGILSDGSAYIGTTAEYYALKEQGKVQEGISIFGSTLVKDGKIAVSHTGSYYDDRASRTAVGITATGKVVFMVLDGRQEPVSAGGSMQEIAQIMLEAGCVQAVNLDGGGSTTYVAKQEGDDKLSVVSKPSDGFERSVSTSLLIVSTAPSSTEFDHAVVDSDVKYLTVGSTVQMNASGVSATGNTAELPEDAYWAVSDGSIASISKDGILTGIANGEVTVNLMANGVVIGSKLMTVVIPDAVYFTKEDVNAIYGQKFELPVAARYQGKAVAMNANDVFFTLNNAAGTTEGIYFIGDAESGIRKTVITVHAVNNPDATEGTMRIALFHANEISFDFENATGGDRLLAWDREVSNATTTDNIHYAVIDKDEDMVTTYMFAIDMTQIPMPERISDLTYMLPGADAADASAWNFLLQLAERISVLTEVKAVMDLDDNFIVDISELNIVSEYFKPEKVTLDEATNTLTISLRWVDQTQAIDPDTANPMVFLSGIKVTPKDDANWDAKDRLTVVNSGEISYDIYMRANALYSFAQKPEHQALYGVYPFVNPDLPSESGGHFASTYATFTDEYTLVNSLANGWVYEDYGYAYYVNGEKLYGIQNIGGYFYDLGEDGINVGQTRYSGMVTLEGVNYLVKDGEFSSGWYVVGDKKYCFDENGKAYDGTVVIDGVELEFENGLFISGYTGFVVRGDKKYYYEDGTMVVGWKQIGDNLYHFNTDTGVMTTGTHVIPDDEARAKGAYYDFSDDGVALRGYFNGHGYYYWAGLPVINDWVKEGSDPDPDAWYHTNGNGHFVTDRTNAATVVIAFDGVEYTFDNKTGKLLKGGFKLEDGQWYYYWAGAPVTDGWFEVDGDTYYAYEDGHLATGIQTIDGVSYMFDGRGRLITEGVIITATLTDGYKQMQVKIKGVADDVTALRVAIWAQNLPQAQTLQWLNAKKTANGEWVVTISMCQFDVEGSQKYDIHVYGTVNGTSTFLNGANIVVPESAAHTYTDDKDTTCNICGKTRLEGNENPDKITSNVYEIAAGVMGKVSLQTHIDALLNGINERTFIRIYKNGVEVKGDVLVGTGMIVQLEVNGVVKDSVVVVVTGDINGDGKVTITDMLKVKASILKKESLGELETRAADVNGDGNISITDFIQMKSHILGKGEIKAQ